VAVDVNVEQVKLSLRHMASDLHEPNSLPVNHSRDGPPAPDAATSSAAEIPRQAEDSAPSQAWSQRASPPQAAPPEQARKQLAAGQSGRAPEAAHTKAVKNASARATCCASVKRRRLVPQKVLEAYCSSDDGSPAKGLEAHPGEARSYGKEAGQGVKLAVPDGDADGSMEKACRGSTSNNSEHRGESAVVQCRQLEAQGIEQFGWSAERFHNACDELEKRTLGRGDTCAPRPLLDSCSLAHVLCASHSVVNALIHVQSAAQLQLLPLL
jgi:hypothetical protein